MSRKIRGKLTFGYIGVTFKNIEVLKKPNSFQREKVDYI